VGPDRQKSGVKLGIKRVTRVIADKSTEGSVGGGSAAAGEPITKEARPADPLASLHEPFVDGTTLQLWG